MANDVEKFDANFVARQVEAGVEWVDIRELTLEGRAFSDTENFYDRWPARAKKVLPEAVWSLGQHSAGIAARFMSDAATLSARWTLRGGGLAMDHMPATGVSGLDLYTRRDGSWRWLGIGRATKLPTNEASLINGKLTPERREMRLYLPLYNGVSSVAVGIPQGAAIEPAPHYTGEKARPICFYGTSILHGGCAARPGMTYPALIGRALDWPHFNFGFSGSARCEPAVAELLAELDPAAFVIDPLPNMTSDTVAACLEEFVQIIHRARPQTPIVLVESIIYRDGYAIKDRGDRCVLSNAALQKIHARLQDAGIPRLQYVSGESLLGDDGEGTVDGTHPTDLGFFRMAQAIGPAVAEALGVAWG